MGMEYVSLFENITPNRLKALDAVAMSEARVVFGGLHIGSSLVALALHEPLVYITLGVAWLFGLLARFYSMVVDGTGFSRSMPGIVVDGGMAFLFLSGLFFG